MQCIFGSLTLLRLTRQLILRKTMKKKQKKEETFEITTECFNWQPNLAATNVFLCAQITTSVGADDVDRLAATWQRTLKWQQTNKSIDSFCVYCGPCSIYGWSCFVKVI